MEAKKKKVEKKDALEEPKKLSKIGEWMRSGKSSGIGEIVDMRAVLK